MTTLKGVIGCGPSVSGEIVVLPHERVVVPADLDFSLAGKILVIAGWAPIEVLQKAGLIGVAAVVTSQLHFRDYDSVEKQGEFSLLLLDKFGKLDAHEVAPDLIRKLEKLSGKVGHLNPEDKTLKIS